MKLKESTIFRRVAATAGAVMLAATGTVMATTAPASASPANYIRMCNWLPSGSPAVDAWIGSNFLGKAYPQQCTNMFEPAYVYSSINYYLDNQGTWVGWTNVNNGGFLNIQYYGDSSATHLGVVCNYTGSTVDASDNYGSWSVQSGTGSC